jgi:hypothetical protein
VTTGAALLVSLQMTQTSQVCDVVRVKVRVRVKCKCRVRVRGYISVVSAQSAFIIHPL